MTGRQCKSLLSVGHPESYTSQLHGITGNTSKEKGPFGSPGVHPQTSPHGGVGEQEREHPCNISAYSLNQSIVGDRAGLLPQSPWKACTKSPQTFQ